MSQQFTIQSESIRDKLNSLLPSQNLGSIGVELTGSTQIVPIVDLTEVAEGSSLRQDLQTAYSHNVTTSHALLNAQTSTMVNTTGYFRVFGTASIFEPGSSSQPCAEINLNDGTTSKMVYGLQLATTTVQVIYDSFDFLVFLSAGDSLLAETRAGGSLRVATRQVADLSGNLTNPT
tara:strand:- start:1301 stop:1828 length:528 start_codon:yes stop_codon:yes gene_type:complete